MPSRAARERFGLDGKARATSTYVATCEERGTQPDSPKRSRPLRVAPLFRLSGVARRLQTAAGMRTPRALERRKIGTTRRARAFWAVWLRCSLLTGRCGHARRSRLAIQPKAFSRRMAGYINRLLNQRAHAIRQPLRGIGSRSQLSLRPSSFSSLPSCQPLCLHFADLSDQRANSEHFRC